MSRKELGRNIFLKMSLFIFISLIVFSFTICTAVEGKSNNTVMGGSEFIQAVVDNNIDQIKNYVEQGGDPNLKLTYQGKETYPLIMAVRTDNIDLVKLLLNNGADISITNSKGQNAYQIAQNSEVNPLLLAELYKAKSRWEEETGETLTADTGNSDKNGQSNSSAKNETKKIAVTKKIRDERKKEENKIIEIVTKEKTKIFTYTSGESFTKRMGGFNDAIFSQNGKTLVLVESYDKGHRTVNGNRQSRDYHKFSLYRLKNGVYKFIDSLNFNTFVDTGGRSYRENYNMALSPDGSLIAIHRENNIYLYQGDNFNFISTLPISNSDEGYYIAISPDNKYISGIYSSRSDDVYYNKWSISRKSKVVTRERINLIKNNASGRYIYKGLDYSPDGRYLIIKGYLYADPGDYYTVALIDAESLEVINDFNAAQKNDVTADYVFDLYFDGVGKYAFLHTYDSHKLFNLKEKRIEDLNFEERIKFYASEDLVDGKFYKNWLVGLYSRNAFYEVLLTESDSAEYAKKAVKNKKLTFDEKIYGISYLYDTDEWVIAARDGLHYIEAEDQEEYEAAKQAEAEKEALAAERDKKLAKMVAERQKKREKAEALYKESLELINVGFVDQGYNKYIEAVKTDPLTARNMARLDQLYNMLGTIEVYQLAEIFRYQKEVILNQEKTAKLGFIPELKNNQWKIKSVTAGTPAEEAGMEVGDHILLFDEQYPENQEELFWLLEEKSPGDQIGLTFISADAEGDYKEDAYFRLVEGYRENSAVAKLTNRIFDYGLLAFRSGHNHLTRKSIEELEKLAEKYPADFYPQLKEVNKDSIIILEALLKTSADSSSAYNYMLEKLDGRKLNEVLQGYFKFSITAEIMAPLYADRVKLSYFTGVPQEELPEVEMWPQQKLNFVDLNGSFIQGQAADPYKK
ncbi:ankyrin repeat protein [Halanaerobium sp. DL-01]|uniref:ankyrin repeat domain-containing protein n=1 Tax=Halanaerobium sp. DL-01 TaxID=1653064 RepID=UPI000DF1ECBB|nr:ankyrin repeat domain-containing protein [Halanaerobium sp. DL-01]RCW83475.1 ankyrin repeat protein [Halanaerobium sp. DL-01]